MLNQQPLVPRGLGPHAREQVFVFLVLAQGGGVGADEARPEGGEELAFEALLGVGFADDGALQVEELPVDGLEEGEERDRVGELGVDAVLEDGEELVEGAVQGVVRALGGRGAEEVGEEAAERGGEAGGAGLEHAEAGEEGVDVGEGGGEGGEGEGGEGGELALRPFHDDEDAVDVAVDVGEELGQLDAERFEAFAEVVELGDDQRGRGHVGGADAFAEVPDCDAGLLEVADLLDAVFGVVD